MSWISDLAKKGEAFLENVDQTAAKTASITLTRENREKEKEFKEKEFREKKSPAIDRNHEELKGAANHKDFMDSTFGFNSSNNGGNINSNSNSNSNGNSINAGGQSTNSFNPGNSNNNNNNGGISYNDGNHSGNNNNNNKTSTPGITSTMMKKNSNSFHALPTSPITATMNPNANAINTNNAYGSSASNLNVIGSPKEKEFSLSTSNAANNNPYTNWNDSNEEREPAATAFSLLNLTPIANVASASNTALPSVTTTPSFKRHQANTSVFEEKEMLQREIETLNDDLKSYALRVKKLEEELLKTQELLRKSQLKNSQDEQEIERITLLLDSERKKLEQKTQEVQNQTATINSLREEILNHEREIGHHKERLAKSLTSLSQIEEQNTIVEKLNLQINELQNTLSEERKRQVTLSESFENKLQRMKEEHHSTSHNFTLQITEKTQAVDELKKLLRQAQSEASSTYQQLLDYKAKAALALQTKEKIIAELKSGRMGKARSPDSEHPDQENDKDYEHDGINGFQSNEMEQILTELMQIRTERDAALTELEENQLLIEQLRNNSQNNETQLLIQIDELKSKIDLLNLSLSREAKSNEELRHELSSLAQKANTEYRESERQIQSLQKIVNIKEEEIRHLTSKLSEEMKRSKSVSPGGEMGDSGGELEKKLALLRDSLVEKQMQIEKLMIDKNSLLLRLETEFQRQSAKQERREENNFEVIEIDKKYDYHDSALRSRGNVSSANFNSGTSSSNSYFNANMTNHLIMSDTRVPQPIAYVANSFDLFIVKTIIFLRRFPAARLSFLCYLIILHIWSWALLQYCTPTSN